MRIGMIRKLRRWGAALLVAAYAFGILGPAVAFARADCASIVHVLSEAHGGMLTLHVHHHGHVHDDDERHDHPTKGGSNSAHHCCGVMAFPGLQPADDISGFRPVPTRTPVALTELSLPDGGGARLERPPRYSLPV
jgi:hypothetical protein